MLCLFVTIMIFFKPENYAALYLPCSKFIKKLTLTTNQTQDLQKNHSKTKTGELHEKMQSVLPIIFINPIHLLKCQAADCKQWLRNSHPLQITSTPDQTTQ